MIISFEEKEHIYSLNGDIANISITELLRKHNLAPDYTGVNKKLLADSAKIGTEIHKDLEKVLNVFDYVPETTEGKNFQKWVNENLDAGIGEQMLGYEYNGLSICGTADVMGFLKDGTAIQGDHKITSNVNKEYVAWEISLADYFARKLGNNSINGKCLKWKGATKFVCFHFDKKTGDMEIIELEKISDEEIEKLIQCESEGKIYQRPVLAIDKTFEEQYLLAEKQLYDIQVQYDNATKTVKELRQKLCDLFKEQNIKSWESSSQLLKVTYIAENERVVVDSKKLKANYPLVYGECSKITKAQASVRVTFKKGGSENE